MTDVALLPENEAARSEAARMDAVRRYDILDSPPDGAFDRITALASRLFQVPIAIVSIVDSDRIWFKSHHGLDTPQIDRDPGLCASAILHDEPWVLTDARVDPRALANPLVAGDFGLRFYAGVPLRTREGFNLGTLCVIDTEPRRATESEIATLRDLAAVVVDELELRLAARRAIGLETELRRRAETVASTLQDSLVPPVLPEIDGLDLASRYHVAQADVVGGDFYDVVATPWGTALVVGDACGKGTMAAGLAGSARWTFHSVVMDERDPAAALERVNSVLGGPVAGQAHYVTMAAASLWRAEDHLRVDVAAGGHPCPIVLRSGGSVGALGATGPIIGWNADSRWTSATDVLEAGDALVLFTDGLLEAIAGHGETDDARLRAILAPLGGRSATEIADAIDTALVAAGTDRKDDAAFLVARAR